MDAVLVVAAVLFVVGVVGCVFSARESGGYLFSITEYSPVAMMLVLVGVLLLVLWALAQAVVRVVV